MFYIKNGEEILKVRFIHILDKISLHPSRTSFLDWHYWIQDLMARIYFQHFEVRFNIKIEKKTILQILRKLRPAARIVCKLHQEDQVWLCTFQGKVQEDAANIFATKLNNKEAENSFSKKQHWIILHLPNTFSWSWLPYCSIIFSSMYSHQNQEFASPTKFTNSSHLFETQYH